MSKTIHADANSSELTYALFESDKVDEATLSECTFDAPDQKLLRAKPYKRVIVWRNVILLLLVHLLALVGLFQLPFASTPTLYFTFGLLLLGTLGVQAGAHRLWAHRTYKANAGLRLFLSLCHVLALQNDLYEWCRDHRAHHKFSDTDADPHNASRGFFFSHVGWLMVKKHPEVKRRGATVDLSDLRQDPIVMFQRCFYVPMVVLIWGVMPTVIPVYFWHEDMFRAVTVCVFFRYAYSVNLTWCVNSVSHLYGHRPYDGRIGPVEAVIRHLLMGEGFHNYHHAFPWDYSASELGPLDVFNPCTAAIDLFHYMGWAWNLKKANPELVAKRIQTNGDGKYSYKKGTNLWEIITGLTSVFGPVLLFRWLLIQAYATV